MISFKNKKILITGATGGIGGALVKKFISLDKSANIQESIYDNYIQNGSLFKFLRNDIQDFKKILKHNLIGLIFFKPVLCYIIIYNMIYYYII